MSYMIDYHLLGFVFLLKGSYTEYCRQTGGSSNLNCLRTTGMAHEINPGPHLVDAYNI